MSIPDQDKSITSTTKALEQLNISPEIDMAQSESYSKRSDRLEEIDNILSAVSEASEFDNDAEVHSLRNSVLHAFETLKAETAEDDYLEILEEIKAKKAQAERALVAASTNDEELQRAKAMYQNYSELLLAKHESLDFATKKEELEGIRERKRKIEEKVHNAQLQHQERLRKWKRELEEAEEQETAKMEYLQAHHPGK